MISKDKSPPPPSITATELVSRTEKFVESYMKQYKDPSHDWGHVKRVKSMALRIARDEMKRIPIDLQLVELAALLHDVGDFKFLAPGETSKDALEKFMKEAEYPLEIQDGILWIVERISFRHELAHPNSITNGPYTWELQCIQDADRLEAIGAIGIARCFAYSGSKNQPLYNPEVAPLMALTLEQYNEQSKGNNSNARNHVYEKLLKLSTMMKTLLGREEAQRRHQLLKTFITEFDRECGLS